MGFHCLLAFCSVHAWIHTCSAENSSVWIDWAGSDFPFSLEFFRILIVFNYKSVEMGKEIYIYIYLALISCHDHHLNDQKVGSAKGVFPRALHLKLNLWRSTQPKAWCSMLSPKCGGQEILDLEVCSCQVDVFLFLLTCQYMSILEGQERWGFNIPLLAFPLCCLPFAASTHLMILYLLNNRSLSQAAKTMLNKSSV